MARYQVEFTIKDKKCSVFAPTRKIARCKIREAEQLLEGKAADLRWFGNMGEVQDKTEQLTVQPLVPDFPLVLLPAADAVEPQQEAVA